MSREITKQFIQEAPKIELHAHLNGCVRRSTLREIGEKKQIDTDFSCFELRDMKGAFKIFDIIHLSLREINDIRRVTREVLQDFKDQNVAYLELRTTPKSCPNGTYNKEDYLKTVLEEMEKFQRENEQKMQVRLLLSIDRGRTIEDAQNTLELLLKYKHCPLIVGLDYSGNPFINTFKDFQSIFEKARSQGYKTTIHIAELEGEEAFKETQDIINFIPDRLGHFNFFNQSLFDQVRKQQIPIEMCPTSNFYTVSLKNMNEHHFSKFFFEDHLISLNTDDTCVFQTDSTIEHQKIIEAFNLTKEQFKQLLLRSTRMIFDDSFKIILQQKIQDYFASTHLE